MKLEDAPIEQVINFLEKTFGPVGSFLADRQELDMSGYAQLAKFLSNKHNFAKAAAELSDLLRELYTCIQEQNEGVGDTFLEVLRVLGKHYGFEPECYTLGGKVKSADFREIIAKKALFHDSFTRPHGEYTHAIQWLVMAYQFKKSSTKVADLYANSVKYISKKPFKGSGNQGEIIYLWNFLVDCFPGPEDFEHLITCETFRCPQIVTKDLVRLPPHSWLGAFISATSQLGLARGVRASEARHKKKGRAKGNIAYTREEVEEMLNSGLFEKTRKGGILQVVPSQSQVWIH
jgi:Family of unknown function (DUF5636)